MSAYWSRNASEETCYELTEFFSKEEMCEKCRDFLERVAGLDQKSRKGSKM